MYDWKVVMSALVLGGVIGWLLAPRANGMNLGGLLPGTLPVPIAGPVVRDTLREIVLRERVSVKHAPARVVERRDTIVQYEGPSDTLRAEPFVLQTDTVLHRTHGDDTVTVRTEFPPPRHSVLVRSSPDTTLHLRETQTIYLPIYIEKATPWWKEALKFGVAAGLGYCAARIEIALEGEP